MYPTIRLTTTLIKSVSHTMISHLMCDNEYWRLMQKVAAAVYRKVVQNPPSLQQISFYRVN